MNAANSHKDDPNMTRKQTIGRRLRGFTIPLALTLMVVTASATQAETPEAAQPAAVTFTTLHSFTGGASDGASPFDALIEDASGNLYGTTAFGGTNNCGNVFELMPMTMNGMTMWTESVLYSFTCGSDGANPYSSLVMDKSGNLYGTTVNGGTGTCQVFNMGCGVVYELMPMPMGGMTMWMYMPIHAFTGSTGDGATPFTGLLLAPSGGLYGTSNGGSSGGGTVYRTDASSNENVLFNFKASADGGVPLTGLTMVSTGMLYGTTSSGGTYGGGTLFSIMPNGESMTNLHSFGASGDGATPMFGSLAQSAQGYLYGTTEFGGTHNCGTVYEWMKMSMGGMTMWTEMVLYNFACGSDGGFPSGSLRVDKQGNVYGTTSCRGCDDSAGTVFILAPSGTLTTVHRFTGGADGGFPLGGLTLSADGTLYGTTNSGGSGGGGTAWSLVP